MSKAGPSDRHDEPGQSSDVVEAQHRAGAWTLLGAFGQMWGLIRSRRGAAEAVSGAEPWRWRDEPAQDWDFVEAQYHADCFALLRAFVQMIRARGLDRSLRGAAGMDGLFLDMDRTPTPGEPCLRVSTEEAGLRFTFLHSTPREADWWTAVYPIEQAEAALLRFVSRVGWFPKGHPLLAGVPLR